MSPWKRLWLEGRAHSGSRTRRPSCQDLGSPEKMKVEAFRVGQHNHNYYYEVVPEKVFSDIQRIIIITINTITIIITIIGVKVITM